MITFPNQRPFSSARKEGAYVCRCHVVKSKRTFYVIQKEKATFGDVLTTWFRLCAGVL